MESMHSMSHLLFNQVEQIADVKTCNVDNVEQKYYKVQWKCTWEPATVLERFCGKILADYNKHPKHVENTEHCDGMQENNFSTDIIEKYVIDIEKSETQEKYTPLNNLTDVQLQNLNPEVEKNSQIRSNIFIKEPSEISATNNDVLNESLPVNNYTSANYLQQRQFDLNNITIKPDPDREVFPNIDILSESNPATFNHGKESNNTSDDQHKFDNVNNLSNNFSIKPDPVQEVFPNINVLCESKHTTEKESTSTNKDQNNGSLSTLDSAELITKPCKKLSSNISKNTAANSNKRRNRTNKCYKCQLCSFSSQHNSNLKTHMLVHTGERPFKCQLCSFSTSLKNSLKTHMPKHTGDYPFKCHLCSYTTTRKYLLKRHHISKHADQA